MLTLDCLFPAISFIKKKLNLQAVPNIVLIENLYVIGVGKCDGTYRHEQNLVEIDSSLDIKDGIRVLFHEIVHFHQFRTNKLKNDNIWKGRRYKVTNLLEHFNSPWELNAYHKADKLFRAYKNYIKYNYDNSNNYL